MSRTLMASFCWRKSMLIAVVLATALFLIAMPVSAAITCSPDGGVDAAHELSINSGTTIYCTATDSGPNTGCNGWTTYGNVISGCGEGDTSCIFNYTSYGRWNPIHIYNGIIPGAYCINQILEKAGYYAYYGATLPTTATFNPTTGAIVSGYRYVRDTFTPANSGLQDYTGHWEGLSFTNTWVKSGTVNQSLDLTNIDTGVVYATMYTGAAASGTTTWDGNASLLNSGAPYGRYVVQVRGTSIISNVLYFQPSGSYIWFDQDNYAVSDSPVISWTIDGAYYAPLTYTYSWIVTDVYGTRITGNSIGAASGTATFSFPTGTTQGVKFLNLEAKPIVGATQIWAWDYATVDSKVGFTGYVNDENGNPISGASVNFTQGLAAVNPISGTDGNYTSGNIFTLGTPIVFNVTKAGYQQWYVSVTPSGAKTNSLNFTLPSNTLSVSGLGIGGIVSDCIRVNNVVTQGGYCKPIANALVPIVNATTGESYSVYSNNAGWYQADQNNGIVFTSGKPYDVWGSKVGYSNSANYTVVPV